MKSLIIGFVAGMFYASAYAVTFDVLAAPFKVLMHALGGPL